MDRTKEFIKGSLRITIQNKDSESVNVLVPYTPEAIFAQIVNALLCGNDVLILSQFDENKI